VAARDLRQKEDRWEAIAGDSLAWVAVQGHDGAEARKTTNILSDLG